MKLTEELRNAIIEKLASRIDPSWTCPLCRKSRMVIMEDFFLSPLQPDTTTFNLGTGKGLLCAVMVCHNCANTVLINLVALGVPQIMKELAERRKAIEKEAQEKEKERATTP